MINYNELFNDLNSSAIKSLGDKLSKINCHTEKDIVANIDTELDLINKSISKWELNNNKHLNNLSPKEYFCAISDDDEILQIFKSYTSYCDLEIPNCILLLIEKSDYVKSKLLEYALSIKSTPENEIIGIEALRILGKIKYNESIVPLIEFSQILTEKEDPILDIISETFMEIGVESIEPLLSILETRSEFNLCHEYMLRALAKIGSTNKSERIYRLLKNTFKNTNNKVFAVLLLSDYGDGRAITALKGYATKNASTISKNLLYEIKYVVEKLGGKFNI
ncbi:MAG: hypothetical protein ABF289_04490 [Clostridiales bacterium]